MADTYSTSSISISAPGHASRANHNRGSTYNSWKSMLMRCYKPSNRSYRYCGARGVIVCERWHIFSNFLEDMGHRPEGMTLDRWPDAAGNYEPGNCRWANRKQQDHNKRDSHRIVIDGVEMSTGEISEKFGVPAYTVRHRINAGMSPDKVIERGHLRGHIIEHNGLRMSVTEWSKHLGISVGAINRRIKSGYPTEKILQSGLFERAKKYEYGGLNMTIQEWSARIGISEFTLYARLDRGWPIEKVLTAPLRKTKQKQ